jgi:hypothetical protein
LHRLLHRRCPENEECEQEMDNLNRRGISLAMIVGAIATPMTMTMTTSLGSPTSSESEEDEAAAIEEGEDSSQQRRQCEPSPTAGT